MTSQVAIEASLGKRISDVRSRMAAACGRAGRPVESVTLIGVTKTVPASAVVAAFELGVRDFGENYIQEALPKMEQVRAMVAGRTGMEPHFHYIGHLQSNKARTCAGLFATVQGIDSARALEALARAGDDGPQLVFLEVNIGREPGKSGVAPEGIGELLARAAILDGIDVRGLMAIPPAGAAAEDSRPYFRQMRALCDEWQLPELSMGMTGDFEVAIGEGATHIRVGRAIFGERPA
ncbi:MAG: YggS family pyridoxal phosphate-dependent enzyme [Chloroflexi bacterium]|nr:YggS family pyridoxal phosphate-dependent enzyme [Chloroflexota bacterium]